MAANTDHLRDIFLDVADEETLTERQQEEPSRDPIDAGDAEMENEIWSATIDDGLEDAVDSGFAESDIAA